MSLLIHTKMNPSLLQEARSPTNIRAGGAININSGSIQPNLGIQRPLSRDFALSLYAVGDPRDRFVGALLRPELMLHPNSSVRAALFVEGGGGYYLYGARTRGGTEGVGITMGLGGEICAEIIGRNAICTSFIYRLYWIEQSVLRSESSITDNGWYFDGQLNIALSLAFSLE